MKRCNRFARTAACLACFISLSALTGSAATLEQPKLKKFLTKPLVIEDEGSFFIGGVPKVTNYATVPAPQLSAGDYGARLHPHRRVSRIDA